MEKNWNSQIKKKNHFYLMLWEALDVRVLSLPETD